MDIVTLALAKNYTNETVDGLGYLKGAPATIKSIEETSTGSIITFEWESKSGSTETSQLIVKNGENGSDGISVTELSVDNDNHLQVMFSNGVTIDAGIIKYDDSELRQKILNLENAIKESNLNMDNLKKEILKKQDQLVSKQNIKTINGNSILGEGNLDIAGGGSGITDYELLSNLPKINGVELKQSKTFEDLNLSSISNSTLDEIFDL